MINNTRGYISLYTCEEGCLSKTINIKYLLDANTSYNILLGRLSINRLKAIVSTPHLAMKFPSMADDIVTVHLDKKTACECYVASLKVEPTRRLYKASLRDQSPRRRGRSPDKHSRDRRSREHMVALIYLDPRLDDARMEAGEDLQPLPLRDGEHKTYIRTTVSQ